MKVKMRFNLFIENPKITQSEIEQFYPIKTGGDIIGMNLKIMVYAGMKHRIKYIAPNA